MSENTKKIKVIIEANPNLRAKFSDWSISYNKRSDMVTMGSSYPVDSFYVHSDDGLMLRIDSDNVIHGFAIENAKFFIKKNPEFVPLYFVIYPYRSFLLLMAYMITNMTTQGFDKMKSILSVSDHITGQAMYS